MPKERPRYALVVRPHERLVDHCLLIDVEDEVNYRQAIVIAREDEDCMPGWDIDPLQRNPNRVGDED
jgi:hypothetical protein